MSAIDQIIEINITQETSSVPQASFSIPLIIGPTVPTTGIVNAYTAPSQLLNNGYTTASPEYIYAQELYEQAISPTEFFVGLRTTPVAQVDTFSVNSISPTGQVYDFNLNGTLITYTAISSDTQQAILNNLLTEITTAIPVNTPVTGTVTGSGSGALLTLTSVVAGQGVNYSLISTNLTHTNTTANNGIATDLSNIVNVNNSWYGIILCSNSDNDIEQLAAAVEPLRKIFIGVSNDSSIPTVSTTDIASYLKSKGYKRTALMYSPLSYNLGIEAGWMGSQLPQTPGSNNWAFKTIIGISPDTFNSTQQNILIGDPVAQVEGKNVNIYQTVGGQDITQMGTMAGGQYIDITIGIDWLSSTLQTNVYQALVSNPKIPYTDVGTGVLLSAVKSAIDQGVVNGLIDGNSPITITAPSVLDVPASQRANRVAPPISFSCRLQGAFNAVIINGIVTV